MIQSNNADTLHRNNLSIKFSFDEGKTWPKNTLIDGVKDPGSSSYTAYSDLVKLESNGIGIIYEKDNYSKIVFKTIYLAY
ncbi:sialidase family protein [Algoriphagus sp. C2-6-M1]|uniref:sialidase family protein n=1 Tax=Algoriphagus persicinus TaxID=3108754 RepID=UPI002B3AD29B|nr:sialidase family protein [Algoriphagus sp. C2-6-M1]MEB2782700.1 sialidase family protein [Algoriphagus sp. C2-6-M1]